MTPSTAARLLNLRQFSWLANEQASSSKSPTIGVYTSLHVLYRRRYISGYISSTAQRKLQYMPPMAHFRHPLQLYSLYRPCSAHRLETNAASEQQQVTQRYRGLHVSTCPLHVALHILYISSTYPLHILYSVCCSICRLWRILGTLYSSTASTGQFSWLADEQASSSKSPTIGVIYYTSLHYPLHSPLHICVHSYIYIRI